jgi:hypothetical protein
MNALMQELTKKVLEEAKTASETKAAAAAK